MDGLVEEATVTDDIELTRILVAKGELPGLVDELALRGSGPTASILVFGNANYAYDLAARVAAKKATDVNGRRSSLPTHMKIVCRVSGYAIDPITGDAASPHDLLASLIARYGDMLAMAVLHLDGLMPTIIAILEPLGGTFRGRESFDESWRPKAQTINKDAADVNRNEKPASERAASVIKPSFERLSFLRVYPRLIEVPSVEGTNKTATYVELDLSPATALPVVAASPKIAKFSHHAPACTVVESVSEDTAGMPSMGPDLGSSPSIVPLDTANDPASLFAYVTLVCRVPWRFHRHVPHRLIRQEAPKRHRDLGKCRKSNTPLLKRRQQHRPRLGVGWADLAAILPCQKREQALLYHHTIGALDFDNAYSRSRWPNIGEGRQRSALAAGESSRYLSWLCGGALAEVGNWVETKVIWLQTASPVQARHVEDVGERMILEFLRARDPPDERFQDRCAIPGCSHDGRAEGGRCAAAAAEFRHDQPRSQADADHVRTRGIWSGAVRCLRGPLGSVCALGRPSSRLSAGVKPTTGLGGKLQICF